MSIYLYLYINFFSAYPLKGNLKQYFLKSECQISTFSIDFKVLKVTLSIPQDPITHSTL